MGDEYEYLESVKPRVYLSGPMDNVRSEVGRNWRIRVTGLLNRHDIQAVDPYDFEPADPKILVRTDLQKILPCQGMIINASQEVETWGTPMETMWAHMHRLINIAFIQSSRPSPWLSYHSSIVKTLDQAVERMVWEIHRL